MYTVAQNYQNRFRDYIIPLITLIFGISLTYYQEVNHFSQNAILSCHKL